MLVCSQTKWLDFRVALARRRSISFPCGAKPTEVFNINFGFSNYIARYCGEMESDELK